MTSLLPQRQCLCPLDSFHDVITRGEQSEGDARPEATIVICHIQVMFKALRLCLPVITVMTILWERTLRRRKPGVGGGLIQSYSGPDVLNVITYKETESKIKFQKK